jgi:hypothetical protein
MVAAVAAAMELEEDVFEEQVRAWQSQLPVRRAPAATRSDLRGLGIEVREVKRG